MFKTGDKVRFIGDYKEHLQEPSHLTNLTLEGLCKKYKNIFTIKNVYTGSKEYTISEDDLWSFKECELEPYLDVDAMNSIIYGITSQIQDEKGPSVEYPREINFIGIDFAKNEIPVYEDYKFEKEKNNMNEILKTYKYKKLSKINTKYNKLTNELLEKDPIHILLEDTQNQINVLMNRTEKDEIKLLQEHTTILTDETQTQLKELSKKQAEEIDNLEREISDIESFFSQTTNFEDRINILVKRKIIDKDFNYVIDKEKK